jgi:hypothetical protein
MINYFINYVKNIANKTKYTKWYCNIIINALSRPKNRKEVSSLFGKYMENHHILPKSFKLDDFNHKDNLVFLTPKEHFIVHLCATKMFNGMFKQKMIYAFQQFRASNRYQKRYINSRFYLKLKKEKNVFYRLYKLDKVKYVNKFDTQLYNSLLSENWSLIMTPEFKEGRVGMMKGKKHSKETKLKMMESGKKVEKVWLIGSKRSNESIEKTKQTKNKNKLENPEKYLESIKKRIEKIKQNFIPGSLSKENNPMFGKKHSQETIKKIKEKALGRKLSQEHKQKISEGVKNSKFIVKKLESAPQN